MRIGWLAAMLVLAGCSGARPEPIVSAPAYVARGQEPGWLLRISDGTIDYQGDYGTKSIRVSAPEARSGFNGHRYQTRRLVIDVTHGRCNDAMSGHGFADQVMVIADGKTVRGCGGERRPDWDQ